MTTTVRTRILKKITSLLMSAVLFCGGMVAAPEASAASPVLPNGNYAIETNLGGDDGDSFVVNAQYAAKNGANMVLDGWNAETHEVFRFTLVGGNDIYRISPLHDTSLALKGHSGLGSQVTLAKYDGTPSVRWRLKQHSNGWSLQNVDTGYYMDVQNGWAKVGSRVTVFGNNGSAAQRYELFRAEPGRLFADGLYMLQAPGSGNVVNVQFAPTSGTGNLVLDPGNRQQNEVYIVRYNAQYGGYTLSPLYRPTTAINCLYGAAAKAGSQAVIHPNTQGDTACIWKASRVGKRYRFSNVASNLYLDIAYGEVNKVGCRINVWNKDDKNLKNQTFDMVWVGEDPGINIYENGTTPAPAPSPAPVNTSLSQALYQSSGGRITCGFDGYTSISGRHEGIDFGKGKGAAVYALTDGVIVGLNKSGLTTIAVYYAAADKTVVYLHTNPLSSLKLNQPVKRGQQIATESDRGAAGAIHTHVEVRNGKKTGAAKSKNDPTLDNPNPTSFWNSLGYSVA